MIVSEIVSDIEASVFTQFFYSNRIAFRATGKLCNFKTFLT